MSPSEQCKAVGLKSLAELSQITGKSPRTLHNWFEKDPHLFRIIMAGALCAKVGGWSDGYVQQKK